MISVKGEMGFKNSIKILKFLMLILLSVCREPALGEAAIDVRCVESEREALLKFKQGLVDDGGVLSSWGSEEEKRECCKWKGITCSNRTGRVIVLDLSGQQMRGNYISPALLELHHLNYLDLSYNYFFGSRIPEFIGSFRKLRHLKLQSTNFIGDVPAQLGNLTNLQTLDLNQIFLNQFVPSALVIKNLGWLSRLSLLSYLDLTATNITETNWILQITKLLSLKELHLKNCQLPKTKLAFDVFANSSFLPSISIINLSLNDLTSNVTFPWLFNFSASLTNIGLSLNQLDGPIPDEFGEIIFLQRLDLYGNLLQGGIPKSFGNFSGLTQLNIGSNNLSMVVLSELFHNLSGKTETTLETLDLRSNQISGSVPDITGFSSLKSLGLRNNRLNVFLPQSLGRLSSLESLDLEVNEIAGSIPDLRAFPSLTGLYISRNRLETLHDTIWNLSKLQNLYAHSNLFNFTVTEVHLGNLSSLKILDLSNNDHLTLKLSSQWIPPFQLTTLNLRQCNVGPNFPKWVRSQDILRFFDISLTGISGTIPSWFWNMSSISNLNISNNQISGTIPNLISTNVSFAYVDLSNNNFSGPIPSFLFRSKTLLVFKNNFSGAISHLCEIPNDLMIEILDLSGNQLTGELPDCWMNKNNLFILNLANNNFLGKLADGIGYLQKLLTLQLRNNNFIGELPSSLKNCTKLRIIDLGENKLTGKVPEWIGTHLSGLTVLSLRFNKFQGELSSTICQLTNIQILDVSRNNISGKIPLCLDNLTSLVQKNSSTESGHMTYGIISFDVYFNNILVYWKGQEIEYRKLGLLKGIDLSNNRLTGNFPQEFSHLRGLVFLNLSRNQLTGNIISNIGQMESLQWLDLSRNQFSGQIPTSLARLYSLSVLDLSDNNLTGEIPLGPQLQTFDPSDYSGNRLCGPPLPKCSRDAPGPSQVIEENDQFITREFYICSAFGFITGFWAVVGTLALKHSWRIIFFNFLGNIGDCIYMTTVINVKRFTRKLRG